MSDPKSSSNAPWSHDFQYILNRELDCLEGKNCQQPEKEQAKPLGRLRRLVKWIFKWIKWIFLKGSRVAEPAKAVVQDERDSIARAYAKQLVGLAFSGGGIRSATFSLGVLQALARIKLLSKFNYLSTVSGGGYIGSWLVAWIKRRGIQDVEASLRPERVEQPGHREPEEIHFLRRFSNYLTPRLGWLGADMWTVIAVYIRNLILNLIILGTALAFILLLPRCLALIAPWLWARFAFWPMAIVALGALFGATAAMVSSMRYFGEAATQARANENIVTGLEKKRWLDTEGKLVDLSRPDVPLAWYGEELFDDFILRLQFEITGPSHGRIFLWTPIQTIKGKQIPSPDGVPVVHVGDAGGAGEPTAAIDGKAPVRCAAVNPGPNDLELMCAGDWCTVRINRETINTRRVHRSKKLRLWPSRRERWLPGAIGLDKGGVHFKNIEVEKIQSPWKTGATQGQVQRRIIAPLFLSAFLGIFLFGFGGGVFTGNTAVPIREWFKAVFVEGGGWGWAWSAFVAGGVAALLVGGVRLLLAACRGQGFAKEAAQAWPPTVSIFFAAGMGGLLIRAFYDFFYYRTGWEVLVWGTPALVVAFLATIVVHLGLLGRAMPDELREWWSRLSAWLLIYSLVWIGIFCLAFYAPPLLRWTSRKAPVWLSMISVGWIFSTISGLIAARSARTGKEKSNKLVEVVAKVAPYIFVVGFLILLSGAVDALIVWQTPPINPETGRGLHGLILRQWTLMSAMEPQGLAKITLGALFIAAILSWRLDINQFSMHLLYRNRLGRCYLGASNRLRRAQPFTGFSADDDLALSDLRQMSFGGPNAEPYPIINTALNLVGGKELAWQQRKAASFVFTPHYCGYEFPELPPGFCETDKFAAKPTPVTLATAMAISGAAASPNMGYHTSPGPAFLMTVFNVRLGWWLGNPRRRRGYTRSGPLNVLWSLACELFGLTSDQRKYIYLSDGGHFENLGIYELVRRRCRFILACDAEEDHLFAFNGLGNAVEKCRSDFGIDIDIDVEPIRQRSEKGHSQWHCAIGKILYSHADRNARDGILVYLKSSLTGDEPTDVLRYAAANPGFPHESTGDQWFDESQFESYRALGFHIGQEVFGKMGDADQIPILTKEQLFVGLAQQWYPPSLATAESFTKHTRSIVAIYDELRNNKALAFLSEDIYPEWRILFQKTPRWWSSKGLAFDQQKPLRKQLPDDEEQLRAGFYICNSVFQLFEDVYVDLHLEEEFDHPDNRGWMNFFRHWSWAPMFRVAWTMSGSNYGARFQSFCQRHLHLNIGATDLNEVYLGDDIDYDVLPKKIAWRKEIGKVGKKIADAIWVWVRQLPVGSPVIAAAAQAAEDAILKAKEASKTKQRPDILSTAEENKVLEEAQRLVAQAFDRLQKRGRFWKLKSKREDQEWHDAATLLELVRRDVSDTLKIKRAMRLAQRALSHASDIVDRLLRKKFGQTFNPIERELIERFFIFNPGLIASPRIVRLEVTPEPRVAKSADSKQARQAVKFPFGFAILAKTKGPQRLEGPHKLVYLRVQDHLRRMGLARQALERLLVEYKSLPIERKKMHPDAHEVPSDEDWGRLFRLYDSVETERREKGLAT